MECGRDIYICLRVYYWIDLSMCKGFELLFLIYDDWGVVIDIGVVERICCFEGEK